MIPFVVQATDVLVEGLAHISLADQDVPTPVTVVGRELQGSDPELSIGVFPMQWVPGPTIPIGGRGEPDTGRYVFAVTTMVKSPNRVSGERLSAIFVHRVRTTLYRHKPLLDTLRALSTLDDETDATERYQKHGISSVDFADSAISGGFVFLSQTEFFIETEVA